ncbi:hypothetical protein HZA85_03365 [Candidatus Uhrbacteria bacterium]|nr:hypothetical protein [Candidatus Uhrbacteria bacterium]
MATQQSQSDTGAFGTDDVIERLGVRVLEEGESPASGTTALVQFRAAPTLKAIGRDLARVAATTSMGNREGARRRWLDRMVMVSGPDGKPSDVPLFVSVTFTGKLVTVKGVQDVGVSAEMELPGLGRVEIQPLFTVGIEYVAVKEGVLVPTRSFTGALFAPKSGKGPGKFVPIDLADPQLIARWNGIVEQGKALNTDHGKWPTIPVLETKIGRPGQMIIPFAPRYQVKETFNERGRDGKERQKSIWVIGTRFGKKVILESRSQAPAVIDASSAKPFGDLEFVVREGENSLIVVLRGRPGQTPLPESMATIEQASDGVDPFAVLNLDVMRYEPGRAHTFVERCMQLPLNSANPLYKSAINLGLIVAGQSTAVVSNQLQALADEAQRKAREFWDAAMKATWEAFRVYTLPEIGDCLQGKPLGQVIDRLNPEDAAAAWITSHVEGEYSHTSPFHRVLRERVLRAVARKAGYRDPAPEGPAADEQAKPAKSEAPQNSGTNGATSPVAADTAEAPKPKRTPRKPTKGAKPKAAARKTAKPKGSQPALRQ